MANSVEICNLALGEVAEQTITTIDDATTPARLCKQFYAQAVREVLAEGFWKCARTPATLVQKTNAPEFGWTYAYGLPVDYVRLYSFNEVCVDALDQELFEIQSRDLLTDEGAASIIYIRDLTIETNGVNVMPPKMTMACYLNLASKLAWPLQQSRTLKEQLIADYEKALGKAKIADSREEFRPLTNPASGSAWFAARY